MPQTDRAPNEVAKHFYDKYGRKDAVMIISKRLTGRSVKQDSEFWLNVLSIIESLDKSNEGPVESQHQGKTISHRHPIQRD